jgi:methylated-DNA-protein-cysteine methyltransferase-like protein
MLTGKMHFSNEKEMENLLTTEGIEVVNDVIVHFKLIFWDPTIELVMD